MNYQSEPELLSLRRMAARLGVTCKWLRERAAAGDVPGLPAENRWLFRPDIVVPAVAAMAAQLRDVETGGDDDSQ